MTLAGDLGRKLSLYFRASAATHSLNLSGFPLLPKLRDSASSRESHNAFLLWIKQLGLARATRIFDVGANHGDFARAASTCFPQAQVWLFEPLPALWPGLARLSERHRGLWRVQQFALGASPDLLPLRTNQGDDTIASFLGFSDDYRQANPKAARSESIPTRVERLDDFCRKEGLTSIDLLKIDVEGFEFDVLAGAATILQNTSALVIEVSLIRQAGGSADALERMIKLLQGCGFHIVDVIPSLFSREEPWKPLEYNLLARRTS